MYFTNNGMSVPNSNPPPTSVAQNQPHDRGTRNHETGNQVQSGHANVEEGRREHNPVGDWLQTLPPARVNP